MKYRDRCFIVAFLAWLLLGIFAPRVQRAYNGEPLGTLMFLAGGLAGLYMALDILIAPSTSLLSRMNRAFASRHSSSTTLRVVALLWVIASAAGIYSVFQHLLNLGR